MPDKPKPVRVKTKAGPYIIVIGEGGKVFVAHARQIADSEVAKKLAGFSGKGASKAKRTYVFKSRAGAIRIYPGPWGGPWNER